MDKAEALAYVSRLFDAAQAGAVLWGDAPADQAVHQPVQSHGTQQDQDGYRARSVSSVAGGIATTHTCICGRSTLRSARTGCPNCGNKLTPSS